MIIPSVITYHLISVWNVLSNKEYFVQIDQPAGVV